MKTVMLLVLAASPLLNVSQGLEKVRSVSGTVRMEVSDARETRSHLAKFQCLNPDRTRLHLLEPEEFEVFQDRTHLWVYDPGNRVVEEYRTDKLSPDVNLMLGRIQKLPWDTLQLLGQYSFTEKKNAQGKPVLLGTADAGMPKCLVWIGDDKLPSRVDTFDAKSEKRLNSIRLGNYQAIGGVTLPLMAEVKEKAITIRLRYSQVKVNPPIKEPFEFKVLPGMKLLKKS